MMGVDLPGRTTMATARGTIRIGISGWRYAPWRGVFYPPGLRQRDELAFAAARFPSIELNGSFYSLQRPEHYRAWRAVVPAGFTFAIKGPRFVTHMLKLRDAQPALANFFASGLLALGDALGPLLWQLPPQQRFDAAKLRAFFEPMPRDTAQALALARRRDVARMKGRSALAVDAVRPLRHALEVRHPSFAAPECAALLRELDVALVVADTAGRWPLIEQVTTDFMYVRLHGDEELYASGYSDDALDRWAARIDAWARGGQPDDAATLDARRPPERPRDVYCYFDNDIKAHAPFDAAGLLRRLAARAEDAPPPATP